MIKKLQNVDHAKKI